ncbi:MAG: phosphate ABC transporter substrate-binding protein [Gammaproteobacteria bacterium]|nr:phosphate ABC transporter substrate-binding protein [Gammaproteobacteria bacterium]
MKAYYIHIKTIIISLNLIFTLPAQAEPANKTDDIIWAGCGITKKAFMSELAKAYTAKTGVVVTLQGGGATKGIRNAAKGAIDIGGACRATLPNHPEERNAYQIPVAWDALVVVVNKENPVNSITFKELQKIYIGQITNWKELGGNNAPIELYIRQGKFSGVGRTLRELVFANYDQEFKAKFVEKSSGPLEKGIVKNLHGIGTTGISSAKRRDLKILKLDDKEPSYDNIKNGEYLLYRPLYLVTKGPRESDEKIKKFISFALSREGKAIIRKAGTVPYADAMSLVMKQLQQYKRARDSGIFSNN